LNSITNIKGLSPNDEKPSGKISNRSFKAIAIPADKRPKNVRRDLNLSIHIGLIMSRPMKKVT
jgi:hypothetical protein